MTPSCNRSTTFRDFAECHLYPQQFWLPVIATSRALKLRTRVAVAQRIEPSNDSGDGCGFESHQSHASSEALGFSHLEPLSYPYLSVDISYWSDFGSFVHKYFTQWMGNRPFGGHLAFLVCGHGAYR